MSTGILGISGEFPFCYFLYQDKKKKVRSFHFFIIIKMIRIIIRAIIVVIVFRFIESPALKQHRKRCEHFQQHIDRKEKPDNLKNESENGCFFNVGNGGVKPCRNRIYGILLFNGQEYEKPHTQNNHSKLEVHIRLVDIIQSTGLNSDKLQFGLHVLHFPDEIHQQNESGEHQVEL